MTTKYYVTSSGAYIGGFADGAEPPAGSIEVSTPPDHASQLWINDAWQAYVPSRDTQEAARKAAYVDEADPLFFMAQRGEATTQEWEAKVAEIKARFPYPTISA
jgi:hypothetical protein